MNFDDSVSCGNDTILGLDLGVKSVGWCLLSVEEGQPAGVLDMGSRIFDAGMDGDVSTGQAESRAVARRNARQGRRGNDRRSRRRRKVMNLLVGAGLLPEGFAEDVLPTLDKELLKPRLDGVDCAHQRHLLSHVLPYHLRAMALDGALAPYELGRALYHLMQRRGFLSNRRAQRADEDGGKVKQGITELHSRMVEAGARTLGEYFAGLDPLQQRIRGRWTGREMFVDEFDEIINAQRPHHKKVLTDEFIQRLRQAMFYQRPLKPVRNLVGPCAHEKGRKRSPVSLPAAQRFRMFQQVNNCEVITAEGEARPFTAEERATLIDQLEREGDLSFAKVKTLLKPFGFTRKYRFNYESGDEKRFVGNRTNAKLAEVFGAKWDELDSVMRAQAVEDVRSITRPETLARRGREVYGLSTEAAENLAKLELEPGYSSLSVCAIEKLLPLMAQGIAYSTAVKEVYGEFDPKTEPLETPPPVGKVAELRNPVVIRVLSELRKVVKTVIARHGKPGRIRIELARDLRKSVKQRKQAVKKNDANRKRREAAIKAIRSKMGIENPRGDDILKYLLAIECDWQCPYTGKQIDWSTLFGRNPQFDIEHIIPFSRSLDDSYLNKTLCYHEENRKVKGNRTPHEAYAGDVQRWDEILQRVRSFDGDVADIKLQRFRMEEVPELDDFISTQLNDTRYASKLALGYLATLYGGLSDADGVRRIEASRGGTTAYVRDILGLNRILNDGGTKTRDDHRHHAVDALAVALTSPAMIKMLSDAAVSNYQRGDLRARFRSIAQPWEGFDPDVRKAVDGIVVSHRVKHKLNGRLHKDSLYARIDQEDGQPVYHIRKAIESLSLKDVPNIVDDKVREAVEEKLRDPEDPARLREPKVVFAAPANRPSLIRRRKKGLDEGRTPIHRVRIRCAVNPKPVGQGKRVKHVATDTNHHMEIVAVLDDQGKETAWVGALVSRMEAVRRKRVGEPIVRREDSPMRKFKFSIAPGDSLKLGAPDGKPELVVVRSVSQEKTGKQTVEFVDLREARKVGDIKKARKWCKAVPNSLRKLEAQKICVSPVGEVTIAND